MGRTYMCYTNGKEIYFRLLQWLAGMAAIIDITVTLFANILFVVHSSCMDQPMSWSDHYSSNPVN